MSEETGADHDHEISIKGGAFSLSDLGRLLPGMAEVMPLVGDRVWKCYYAGKAHNRALARFQLAEAVNLMKKGSALRPKYVHDIEKFVAGPVASLRTIIQAEDWDAFDEAFQKMVDEGNRYHDVYDKSFLKWKLPDEPPPDLDLSAT